MASTQHEIKELREDIESLKNLLADQIEETASNGASKTKMIKDDVKDYAREAGANARIFLAEKREQAGILRDRSEQAIQERPFITTATAFLGGLLVANLLKRR